MVAASQQIFTSISNGTPLARTIYCDIQVFAPKLLEILREEKEKKKLLFFLLIRRKSPFSPPRTVLESELIG